MEERKGRRKERRARPTDHRVFKDQPVNAVLVTRFHRLSVKVWLQLSSQRPQSPRYIIPKPGCQPLSCMTVGPDIPRLHSQAPQLCPYRSKQAGSYSAYRMILWVGRQ